MVGKKNELFVYFYDIPNVRKYWGLFLTIGILLIALGILAIGYAGWATQFTVMLLGVILVAAGVMLIVSGYYAVKWTGFSFSLLLGLFYVFAGGLFIFRPAESAIALSLVIAVLLLIAGTYRLVSALRYKFDNYGWVVFTGIVSILLGLLILGEYPSAMWVIGLFVGIDMLLTGCYWVGLSLAIKE